MNQIRLSEIQIENIRKLAIEKRSSLGFVETPIANDVFTILDKLEILLLEYPIETKGDKLAFSAAILYSEDDNNKLTFLGLNTADYYDKQIFAIAHELYHYFTKSGSHLSRIEDIESSIIEMEANRFAAEFLLPETALKSIVLDEFKTSCLKKFQHRVIYRFIARLHCTWWLPYRSIVKRLYEIAAISLEQYTELYAVNERDSEGEYFKIGMATNREVFHKLNKPTKTVGTSPHEIEIIIRNFEDNLIDENKFAETLSLFNKTPHDFGYEIKVSKDDIDEINDFFGDDDED